ncbi:MAG: T9SS C-terminal target domain-containing protein [Cytophagales bacterium]|nr:MAG: T9SS C-terminal target domain-containing protein [Cytophagales bacterium]
MKLKLFTLFAASCSLAFVIFEANTFPSMGFGDSTGAPNKNMVFAAYTTCRSPSCHGGKPLNSSLGSADIITNIPTTGWEPGVTYQIKGKVNFPDRDVFGFQIMAWGSEDSASVGKLVKEEGDNAVIRSSVLKTVKGVIVDTNEYATHQSATIYGDKGTSSHEWTIHWTAPSNKSQEVVFYGTFLAANGNGGVTGDYVYRIEKSANSSSLPLSTNSVEKRNNSFHVFPHATEDFINITAKSSLPGSSSAKIYSQNGNLIADHNLNNTPENTSSSIDVKNLNNGIYFLKIEHQKAIETFKFIKK